MTVYADIVFLVNFVFDAQILLILLKLSSKKIPPLRFLLSTCIGGLQGIFVFIPYFRILCMPPARFLIPLLMVSVIFSPCKTRELLKLWVIFLTISFVFSGAINFFGLNLVCSLMLPIPLYTAIVVIKKNIVRKKETVILAYHDKKLEQEGFFDSGNMLFHNGNPVILASSDVFKRLFGDGFSINAVSEWIDVRDFCVIPYKALGKTGIVFGIKLDFAVVAGKRYDGVVLGYCNDNFSDNLILNSVMT